MQFYFLAKYSCLVLICPRELTYYLKAIFFFALLGRLCVCMWVCVCVYTEKFWWLFAKADNNIAALVSVYFSPFLSSPVSHLPIDLVQPVKFYSPHLRRPLLEIHEGLLIRTNCKHQVQQASLSWPIGLREHEGLISWLIKLSVKEASQTNEHWLFFTRDIKMVFYHDCLLLQGKKSHPCWATTSHLGLFVSLLSCPGKISKRTSEPNSSLALTLPWTFWVFLVFDPEVT